jgi:hypothetical protein
VLRRPFLASSADEILHTGLQITLPREESAERRNVERNRETHQVDRRKTAVEENLAGEELELEAEPTERRR